MVKIKKKPIILIRAGGHAESCIDLLSEQDEFELKEIVGKKNEINKKVLNKYTVKYCDNSLNDLVKKFSYALIGVGQIKDNKLRVNIFKKLKKLRFKIPYIFSRHALISKYSKIGEGSVVMHGAIIGPNVVIGKNCIINSNSIIEHGSRIGDNVHVATSVTINSSVIVGSGTFIGSGSVLKQIVNLKKDSFIKMGSVIKHNQ